MPEFDPEYPLDYFVEKFAGYWRREVHTGFNKVVFDEAMHDVVHKYFGELFPYSEVTDEIAE